MVRMSGRPGAESSRYPVAAVTPGGNATVRQVRPASRVTLNERPTTRHATEPLYWAIWTPAAGLGNCGPGPYCAVLAGLLCVDPTAFVGIRFGMAESAVRGGAGVVTAGGGCPPVSRRRVAIRCTASTSATTRAAATVAATQRGRPRRCGRSE